MPHPISVTGYSMPIQVAARSQDYVCGRSLAGNVGSKPAGNMDGFLWRALCRLIERFLRPAVQSVECLGVIVKP